MRPLPAASNSLAYPLVPLDANSGTVGKVLEVLQMRLGECAPRVTSNCVAKGQLKRAIQADERWLEFKVGSGERQHL